VTVYTFSTCFYLYVNFCVAAENVSESAAQTASSESTRDLEESVTYADDMHSKLSQSLSGAYCISFRIP